MGVSSVRWRAALGRSSMVPGVRPCSLRRGAAFSRPAFLPGLRACGDIRRSAAQSWWPACGGRTAFRPVQWAEEQSSGRSGRRGRATMVGPPHRQVATIVRTTSETTSTCSLPAPCRRRPPDLQPSDPPERSPHAAPRRRLHFRALPSSAIRIVPSAVLLQESRGWPRRV